MKVKVILLLCTISAVMTFAYAEETELLNEEASNNAAKAFDGNLEANELEHLRFRRQLSNPNNFKIDIKPPVSTSNNRLQLSGGGGGSPARGYDINIDGRAPAWTSNNGRHEIGANAGYSQHLGGPYGNSKPDFRGGVGYTFRF